MKNTIQKAVYAALFLLPMTVFGADAAAPAAKAAAPATLSTVRRSIVPSHKREFLIWVVCPPIQDTLIVGGRKAG